MSNRYAIILNPTANRGKASSALPKIEKVLNENNKEYEIIVTRRPNEATEIAKRLVAAKQQIIIAAGGDGTVYEIINGIVNQDVQFGIIPLGSGNDFAQALGYGKNLKKNIKILLQGNKHKVDLGKVNGQYFINNVSIGFDAVVAKTFNKGKNIMLGKAAYVAAIFKALWRLKTYQFRLTTSEFDKELNITLVAITNTRSYGGGIPINPTARIDDGFLNLCLVDKMSRSYLIKSLPKLLKGKHAQLPEVKMMTAKKITISSRQPLPISYDGEVIEDKNHLAIEVLPSAIEIIGK
ncbi:diacylglycerol/lipid kinase family protein [Patescibacteria group bacterium]